MSTCETKPNLVLHNFTGPVTALGVVSLKNRVFILVGCGNEVSVYCLENYVLRTRRQVLHGSSIHGFSQGDYEESVQSHSICVYGAKQACVVYLKQSDDGAVTIEPASKIRTFPDWIWEATWLKSNSRCETIAFGLAHNTVLQWDWKEDRILNRRDCVEKCILYCAHFIGTSWDDLMVAAGTVFNQVVLWSVADDSSCTSTLNSDCADKPPAPVMHTFGGHKGVIFSIRYHTKHQHLCSVSDDRSIRMWQIEFPSGQASTTASPTCADWKGMKSTLLLSVFGHSARVFGTVLMDNYFASIGEDATCCIWNYSGDVLSKFKGHKGKSIWSIANTLDEKFLVTGGGDGSIRLWTISVGDDSLTTHTDLDVSNKIMLTDGDFPRTVTLLDHDRLLLMMNSGCLYLYLASETRFECLFQDSRFMSYSIVCPCLNKKHVAVASITGNVKVLAISSAGTVSGSCEVSLFDSKVLGLVWVSSECLAATGPAGTVYLLHITTIDGEEGSENMAGPALQISVRYKLFLPASKHRWISAACFVGKDSKSEFASSSNSTILLACGDKSGTICCYSLPPQSTDFTISDGRCQDLLQPNQEFPKIHGKNGVTYMCFKDGILYSLGRDGCCRHWVLKDEQLVLLHGSKVMKGFEWIDRLEFFQGDILYYGFFSSQFVVWSQQYNQKLFSVECGGGHRSWGCSFHNQAFRLVYLKGGQVYFVDSSQCSKHEILRPALHGRELNDVKIVCGPTAQSSDCRNILTFTASEDTMIILGLYHYNNQGLVCWRPLAELKGHLSSVRALVLSLDHSADNHDDSTHSTGPRTAANQQDNNSVLSQRNFLLFSGGGRAEIRVWKVTMTFNNNNNINNISSSSSNNNAKTNGKTNEKHDVVTNSSSSSGSGSGSDSSKAGGDFVIETKSITPISTGQSQAEDPAVSVSCTHREWSTHYLGESRHKRPWSKWKARKLQLDPETRVMSLDSTSLLDGVCCLETKTKDEIDIDRKLLERLYIVSAAGSDGIFRVFCYNDHTRRMSTLAQSRHHNGCVLKVKHFVFKSESKCKSMLLAFSTSTNGQIVIWLMSSLVNTAICLDHHQSKTGHVLLKHREDSELDQATRNNLTLKTEGDESINEAAGVVDIESATSSITDRNENSHKNSDKRDENCDESKTDCDDNTTKSYNYDHNDRTSTEDKHRCKEREDISSSSSTNPQPRGGEEEVESSFQPICSLPAHQSGINSIDVWQADENSLLVASGGDDNALTVQMLDVPEKESIALKLSTTHACAHSAQITGVKFVSRDLVVSASIDQRICVWKLYEGCQELKLDLVNCCYIYLADVSCLDTYVDGDSVYLSVGGEGMCLYSWNKQSLR